MQDKAQLIVGKTVKELMQRLRTATDALLALADEDLLEERSRPMQQQPRAAVASPKVGRRSKKKAAAAQEEEEEEGEEAFAARVALLRVRCMLLGAAPAADVAADLQKCLDRLLTVGFLPFDM